MEHINLSYPPPAVTSGNEPSVMSGDQQSASSHLAAQYSQGQLTEALIRPSNPQDFSGNPLPSGASTSTQSMVFSHDGSAAGALVTIPGPTRHRVGQAKRFEPYPASSLHSGISTSSMGRRVALSVISRARRLISYNPLIAWSAYSASWLLFVALAHDGTDAAVMHAISLVRGLASWCTTVSPVMLRPNLCDPGRVDKLNA